MEEIERRWIVTRHAPANLMVPDKTEILKQGYLERSSPLQSLRVRIIDDERAVITGKTGAGMVRNEQEHAVSLKAASMLFQFCDHRITKHRQHFGKWTLDTFGGELAGIRVLEYEGSDENEVRDATLPLWVYAATEVTDSLTNLHLARLATDLRGTNQEALPLLQQRLFTGVKRIVVTGGPGSGKSTLLEEIRAQFPDVHIVPEAATIIISQVGIRPFGDPMALRRFQLAVWRTQIIFEMTSAEQAAASGKSAIVLDRGTLDNAAYLPGGIGEMEELFRTTRDAECCRYDAVLWLPPAPREVYERIRANNPARSEGYATAVALGERIHDAWRIHPSFMRLDTLHPAANWDELVDKALNRLAPWLKP